MLESAWATITEAARVGIEQLLSPEKRLFAGYLITSALLAYWVFRRRDTKKGFLAYLFPKRIWLSDSAKLDYQLVILNSFVKVALLGALLIYGLHLASWVDRNLSALWGTPEIAMGPTATLIAYTLTMTIVGDLSVYVVHRMMHRIPALWAVHRIHHSATHLTPVTQLRLHPLELVINNVRSLVVFGLITGLFRYLSGHQIHLITFLGLNVLSFAFFVWGANLRHSHVRLSYWHRLEHILISPFQHQIHHSTRPEHHDKNFGSKFALWDLMFGTLVTSRGVGKLRFGIPKENSHDQTLLAALFAPISNWRLRRSRGLPKHDCPRARREPTI